MERLLLMLVVCSILAVCRSQQHLRVAQKDRPMMTNGRSDTGSTFPVVASNGLTSSPAESQLRRSPIILSNGPVSSSQRVTPVIRSTLGTTPTREARTVSRLDVMSKFGDAQPKSTMTRAISDHLGGYRSGGAPGSGNVTARPLPVKRVHIVKRVERSTVSSQGNASSPTIIARPAPLRKVVKTQPQKLEGSGGYKPIQLPILHLLNGTAMNPIQTCPSQYLRPENIHLVTLASPYYLTKAKNPYVFSLETVKFYAELHGYHYHMVNPIDIMEVYGAMKPDLPKMEIISTKSLVMLYTLKELFHNFGCNASWVVFMDADIAMNDLTRSLESLIDTANRLYGGVHRKCSVVAQMGPFTINTGFLLFKVNAISEKILTKWVEVHQHYSNKGQFWVTDQGWFQYVYTKHLEKHYGRAFMDCADMSHPSLTGLIQQRSLNVMRSYCFAKVMHLYDLLGKHVERQASYVHDLSVNRSVAVNGTIAFQPINTRALYHHNDPIRGTKYCMLEGYTTEDRFNFHDFVGEQEFNKTTGEHYLHLHEPRVDPENDKEKDVPSNCILHGVLFYHGKNFDTVDNLVGKRWTSLKEQAMKLLSDARNTSSATLESETIYGYYPSVHLFPFVEDPAQYDTCNKTMSSMLLIDALKNYWLPPEWRKMQEDFYNETLIKEK